MKLLPLLLALIPLGALALPVPDYHFSYVPNEGAEPVACTHERIRDLPDWKVRCTFSGEEKEFTAHVVLRQIPAKENSVFELLYWVTAAGDSSDGPPKFHSTSAFLKMKGNTAIASLALAQGVENDYASLVLETSTTDSSTQKK